MSSAERSENALVVMMGLPGTGKSAIAEGVAKAIGAPVFSVDPIEAALLRSGVEHGHSSGLAAYEVAATLARSQLMLTQSAVIDAVNSIEIARSMWRDLAAEFGVRRVLIECVCSDRDLHRRRIESRRRNIPGFIYEPTWRDVEARRAEYEPCTEDRLVLDAVKPIEANLREAVAYVTGDS
jgi:predicted kinase